MTVEINTDNQTENTTVVTDEQTSTPEPQSNPTVEKARALGWVSREEWVEAGHDEDDWKPAKTFLEVGEMIGKLRAKDRELQETKQALNHVATKSKQVYENGYKAALTELRAQKRAALQEGDFAKADELDEKIDETKDQIKELDAQVTPKVNAPDPVFVKWVSDNPWYEQDTVLHHFADSLAVDYINQNKGQVSQDQVFEFVTKTVRETFPQKFPGGKKMTVGAPNPDGEGRSTQRQSNSKTLDSKLQSAKANMSEQERQIMKTMMRATGLTEAEYLKQYAS